MFEKKFIDLSDRNVDNLLVKLMSIYKNNYRFCETLLLLILTTEMGET